jgi:hypothetical protein
MHLVAEVLDQQLCDARGKPAGRVDGIVLELRDDKPPRVAFVEVSPITFLARINRRLGQWYARRDSRFGEGRGVPFRIPWTRLTPSGTSLQLDFDSEATPIVAVEEWLRRHIVERIPGG